MAKVKYRIREFKPTQNQSGGHSFFAEAVVDNIITNKELGKKVHDVGSISSPAEIKAIFGDKSDSWSYNDTKEPESKYDKIENDD